ncbi:putative Cytochrome P450 monooxygenase [Seiridium cardinale]
MGSLSQSDYDDQIPVASLQAISFAALERKDPQEIKQLLEICTSFGFFYLDFDSSNAKDLPLNKQKLLQVMNTYFNQPQDDKMIDDTGSTTRGYVSGGSFSAVDLDRPNESFEHLAIGSYELLQDPAKTLPHIFQHAGDLVQTYIKTCEHVVDVLLDCLTDALGLSGESHLGNHHRHQKPSDTILALLSYPGQLTHQKHTDVGSLTVLFSDQWGLQIIAPETTRCEWVEPRLDQAVINVGDTLRFFTDKTLYSCLHRVIREGRASLEGHRYSIAYLLRPDSDAVFEDTEGVRTTAKNFVDTKYEVYSAPHEKQQQNAVLTGGMERVLGVEA